MFIHDQKSVFLSVLICFEYCEGTSSGYINNAALINDYYIIVIINITML